jgi:hypothetical protein
MMADKRTFKSRQTDESWFQSHWRSAMAWSYGAVCLWDFMLAPIFFAWFANYTKTPYVVWVPLTTQGGGLYHLAMGAIIGVTSYGKTQEKVSNNTLSQNFQPLPSLPVNSDPASSTTKPATTPDTEQ